MTDDGRALDDSAHSAAHAHNRRAWNERATRGERFTRPASDADVENFGSKIDLAWCGGSVAGRRVLCLAAGGGRQSALYAAAGAVVTVVDLSGEMLALDRAVAKERGLAIRAVETSMDDLSMFAVGEFDLVVQPVSTCYVPDVLAVYRQVARIIVPGGVYISQHKQPASLQCSVEPSANGYELTEPYYRSGPLPPALPSMHREPGTLEYLHRWQELLGGLCRSGFVIEDADEPLHAKADAQPGTFAHRSQFVAPYVRFKARRTGSATDAKRVWTPN